MLLQRRARAVTLYCVLTLTACLTAAPITSCAAALPLITQVASIIAEITGVVDLINSQARATSDAGQLPVDVAKRITAVRAAVQRINDAARLGPAAYAAAVAEFERLYAQLTAIVAPLGVRAAPLDGRLAAAPPGTVQVPTAGELGARLRAVRQ